MSEVTTQIANDKDITGLFKGLNTATESNADSVSLKDALASDAKVGRAYHMIGYMATQLGVEKPMVRGDKSHWCSAEALNTVEAFMKEL